MTAAEIAAYTSLLGTLGGGVWIVWNRFLSGTTSREDRLAARERSHDEHIDARVALLEAKLERSDAAYTAVFGVLQVMVDYQIATAPLDPGLDTLSATLRAAFPVESEMPKSMAALLMRLDARPSVRSVNALRNEKADGE